jgi:hypothetical protein
VLGAIAGDSDVVGEPPFRRVKSVAGRDIDVFVRMVGRAIAAGNELRAGHAQIYVNLEKLTLMPVSALDHNPARGDAVENLFELGGFAPYPRFQRRRGVHVAKGDLKRQGHRMPPAVSRRIIGNGAPAAIDPKQASGELTPFQHCISSMLTPSGAAM